MTILSPSNRTITDKLCDQAQRQIGKKLDVLYEKSFPHHPAGDEFFAKIDEFEKKVATRLAERPLTRAEINGVVEKAGKILRAFIRDETKRSAQPRYREAINMETGERRLIPDYGD